MTAVDPTHNPQAAQMADESMVRNLAAQAEATWPQEAPLLARYGLPAAPRIVDLPCGTGEASARLLATWPAATLLGLDVDPAHLARARARCAFAGARAEFREADAFAPGVEEGSADLVVCRHFLQAVPEPERVLAGMARMLRPGGVLHLVAEDYGMIFAAPVDVDLDHFWRDGPLAFGRATGTDLASGRKVYGWLRGLGLVDVRVDWLVLDTVRVPRGVLARIWTAWRDGYSDVLAARTALSAAEVAAAWDALVRCTIDPDGYVVWHLPVVSGRSPAAPVPGYAAP